MDQTLRFRAPAALAAIVGLTLTLAPGLRAQEDVAAPPEGLEPGFELGQPLEDGAPRPESAYDWGTPVEGESASAAPMAAPMDRTRAPSRTTAAFEDSGGEYLVDTSSTHLDQRSARYRYGAVGRIIRDGRLEGFGAGVFIQGPDWIRDVDTIRDPDPKLVRGWRLSFTTHDLDFENPPSGATALQGEEVNVLTLGAGWDYFFNRQFRAKRDENGRTVYDRFGDVVKVRNNSPYLSAWLEGWIFVDTQGTTLSTQEGGSFRNDDVSLTLGGGYQFGSRMRIGVEHAFIAGPVGATSFSVGSSF